MDYASKHMGAKIAEVQGKAKTLQESSAQAFSGHPGLNLPANREAAQPGKARPNKSVEELRSEVLRLNDGLQQHASELRAQAMDYAAKHMGAKIAEVQGRAKTLQESSAQAFSGHPGLKMPANREAAQPGKARPNKSVEELRSEVLRLNDGLQQRAEALRAEAMDYAAKHMGAKIA